ncbi:MAG TPA: GWxTD domain-containing protein [bacterium]
MTSIGLLFVIPLILGQESRFTAPANQDSLHIFFREAMALINEQKFDEAETLLHRVIASQPAFVDSLHGSAWLALGEIYHQQNQSQLAVDTWFAGLQELNQRNLFDPLLGEAFVEEAVQLENVDPEFITDTYYAVLEQADAAHHSTLLERAFATCSYFLREDIQQEFSTLLAAKSATARPGQLLRQFWRQQDLTPATPVNERLLEHLQRVAYARRHFTKEDARGFDDRGGVYVRFGPPSAKASAGTIGLDTTGEDPRVYYFKPHEVWSYRFLGIHIFFPFVDLQDGQGFVQVERIEDAIPKDSFSSGGTKSQRGSTAKIDVRLYFYNQLAKSNPFFYQWAKELQDIKGDPVLANTGFMDEEMPSLVRSLKSIHATTTLDFQAEEMRVERTPDVASQVLGDVADLPLAVQTARFLERDGTTRVELYFGFSKNELVHRDLLPILPIDTVAVELGLVIEDISYWPQASQFVDLVSIIGEEFAPAPDTILGQVSVKTNLPNFFVSGQVESWLKGLGMGAAVTSKTAASFSATESDSRSLLKLTSFRTARQQQLPRGASLRLSDLQVSKKIVEGAEKPTPSKGALQVEPYPFRQVSRKAPLFLYFEIYGLQLAAESSVARYRIAYEAEQLSTRQGLWGKLKSIIGRGAGGRVELDSEYTGNASDTQEWIALDLSALPKGEVQLRVKVTDLVSGDASQREIALELF